MTNLEDLQPNASIRATLSDSLVTVVSVQWFGSKALKLTYRTPAGRVANELLYRHDEPRLEIVEQGPRWSFGDDRYQKPCFRNRTAAFYPGEGRAVGATTFTVTRDKTFSNG